MKNCHGNPRSYISMLEAENLGEGSQCSLGMASSLHGSVHLINVVHVHRFLCQELPRSEEFLIAVMTAPCSRGAWSCGS